MAEVAFSSGNSSRARAPLTAELAVQPDADLREVSSEVAQAPAVLEYDHALHQNQMVKDFPYLNNRQRLKHYHWYSDERRLQAAECIRGVLAATGNMYLETTIRYFLALLSNLYTEDHATKIASLTPLNRLPTRQGGGWESSQALDAAFANQAPAPILVGAIAQFLEKAPEVEGLYVATRKRPYQGAVGRKCVLAYFGGWVIEVVDWQ